MKSVRTEVFMKEQIDDNVDAVVRVEKGRRDRLDGHVEARAVVNEAQTSRPVVRVQRVERYGSEQ